MEESLVSYLLASAGLTALIGTRVYWTVAPQNAAKPYITLHRIGGARDMNMLAPSGLVESRVQVDCYGLTYASSKTTARAVEVRMSGAKTTHSATVFDGAFLDAERDGYEDEASPDKLFRTSLDFIIWHKGET